MMLKKLAAIFFWGLLLAPPASAQLYNIKLTGDVVCTNNTGGVSNGGTCNTAIGTGVVTNTMLAGSIAASKLVGTDITTVGTITTGTWSATRIALAKGGTNADLSATGGAHFVLQQSSVGAAVTVAQLSTADLLDIATVSLNTSGTIKTTNATNSTSTTTGAMVVTGGLGVGGALYTASGIQSNSGGISSLGANAAYTFQDRTSGRSWAWYGTGDVAYLHNGTINVAAVDPNGVAEIGLSGEKVSTSTLTKTSNTTLATVPGLSVPLIAGKTYSCHGHLVGTSSVVGGFNFAIVGSGGLSATSFSFTGQVVNGSAVGLVQNTSTTLGNSIASGGAAYESAYINGAIVVNAGGTINVQAAQNASDGTATTVLVNSTFGCTRTN